MPAKSRFPFLPYCLACLFALLTLSGFWYSQGKSVAMPDAVTATHKLQCASYSPFDKDQSPFDQPLEVRPARVDADLEILSHSFQCVRSYSMAGLDMLPAVARKYGLKLIIGAWISSNTEANEQEVSALIASANANPDVVQRVIVGNETLLRKELTSEQLIQLIRKVKSQVKQPVSYADAWGFWIENPNMAPEVDFITVHLLPYWDDHTQGIDDAVARVARTHDEFAARFAPKDLLIGETGWPSEGRQRDTAVASRVNQARFMRDFVALADSKGWQYNLIEGFDQPWKRSSEGAVGGYWGLFDADRQDKGVLAGAVSNLPDWPRWLLGGGLFGAAVLWLAGRPASRRAAWALPPLAALAAAGMGAWLHEAFIGARSWDEWLWAAALLAVNFSVLMSTAWALSANQGWRAWPALRSRRHSPAWLLTSGFAGAVSMLEMAFEPQYRGFSTSILILPAVVYLLRPVPGPRRELCFLALLIIVGIPAQLYMEGFKNQQAWAFETVSLLLALGLLRCAWMGRVTSAAR